jgi:hypothetical protein
MQTPTLQPVTRHPLSAWPLDTPLSVEAVPALRLSEHDAEMLDAQCLDRAPTGVFMSQAWLSGMFADPPPGLTPSLLLFRAGTGCVAPCRSGIGARPRPCACAAGGGLGSDRVDLLAARGKAAAADAFLTWIGSAFGRRSAVLELRDVPADSSIWGAIFRANDGSSRRFTVQPRELHTLPYLDLTESSYRLSDGACPAGDLKSFDRHFRWLERRGRLRIEVLQDAGDVLAAFESLTSFLHARWDGRGGSLVQPGARASIGTCSAAPRRGSSG